jgi:hypothetical protein
MPQIINVSGTFRRTGPVPKEDEEYLPLPHNCAPLYMNLFLTLLDEESKRKYGQLLWNLFANGSFLLGDHRLLQ